MPPTDYPTSILFKPTEQLQVMGLSPADMLLSISSCLAMAQKLLRQGRVVR